MIGSRYNPRNNEFLNLLIQVSVEDLLFSLQTAPTPTQKAMIACWYGLICIIYVISGILGLEGKRGLFLKNVLQGGCPLHTAAQQFQATQYYFSVAPIINLTRVKLVNNSYITQQRLIPHIPDKCPCFWLYTGGSNDLFKCVHAFSYWIFCALPMVMWQYFHIRGVKMMKTVKLCLSSLFDKVNVHDIQKLGGTF